MKYAGSRSLTLDDYVEHEHDYEPEQEHEHENLLLVIVIVIVLDSLDRETMAD